MNIEIIGILYFRAVFSDNPAVVLVTQFVFKYIIKFQINGLNIFLHVV